MKKIKNILLPLLVFSLLVIIFMACDTVEVEDYSDQLNVYTVLINGHPAWVHVDQTYGINEPSEPRINDALVTISSSNRTDTLDWAGDIGWYVGWYIHVYPETTYYLEVSRQELDTLFAETTIPGSFYFLHQPYDTLTLEDTMFLSMSRGGIVYYCRFTSVYNYISDDFWFKPDTLDSLIKIRVGDVIGDIPAGLCVVSVIAFDRNYYEYTFEPDDSLRQAGVTNGLGLCGSACYDDIPFYLNIPE